MVDAVALAAVAARISELGFTPNRVAALGENLILLINLAVSRPALGENLILLINLAGSAWLYALFLRGGRAFGGLENW